MFQRQSCAGLLVLIALINPPGRAQEGQEVSPTAALTSALVAVCRHQEAQFSRYLTAENAAAFRELPTAQRVAVMKRLVVIDEPGRPLLSDDAQGRTVLRCETRATTAELRLGPERIRENLAFVPVEAGGRRTEFGMVREGGGWRMISLGLLLLNLPELAKQWAAQELEARESAAIATLRKLAEAVKTYHRAYGRLPEQLAQLGPAPKEGVSPDSAQLVDAGLAEGKSVGYMFRYRIVPPADRGAETGFELAAVPAEYGKSGRRSFFLDSSGTLRGGDKQGAAATSADPRIETR